MKKIIKLTESDLARIVRRVITEANTNSYTVKNDTTLENSNTAKTFPELKLFKGATFTKVPGAKELVATTKYQFVDTLTGQVMTGPNSIVDSYTDDTLAAMTYGVSAAIGSVGGAKTYSGKVTYYCGIGKFKVKETKDEYFDEDFGLSDMLKGACNATDTPTPSPDPLVNHVCEDKAKSTVRQGRSYKYCKNGQNYYFKGIVDGPEGNFKTQHPSWTLAKGSGLASIKSKIFYDMP